MPNIFAALAQKATTLSSLMENREKLSTENVINQYPNGITVTAFDTVEQTTDEGEITFYPIIIFAEDDTKFVYGGKALHDIVALWLKHFDGDIDSANAALKAGGGVKLKMELGKTKNGRNFTRVKPVLD